MARPKELFWVDVKLSGEKPKWKGATSGVRGGKRSSMSACENTKALVLAFDPKATVTIWATNCDWWKQA